MSVQIATPRFQLRELTVEDVTARYLSWFDDAETAKYITAAAHTKDLSDLRTYVRERVGRDDVLFLGIFNGATGVHVGNIKYEPVDGALGYAIMGILIGDPAYRGKGVATEVLEASAAWLKEYRNINQIVLGVDAENLPAIRAYEKVGFVLAETPHIPKAAGRAVTMVWLLP